LTLAVVYEIPADLNGVYLRNGPNPRLSPTAATIHSTARHDPGAHFDRGRVTYRNKGAYRRAAGGGARGASPFWGIMGTLKAAATAA
jgi:carotenoid cleavage dioxygenase